MILITTAGKVGSEAVLRLRQREVPVRVLVRNPEKAKALADAGAEIAVGDLDAPASIDAAVAGITTRLRTLEHSERPGNPGNGFDHDRLRPGRRTGALCLRLPPGRRPFP